MFSFPRGAVAADFPVTTFGVILKSTASTSSPASAVQIKSAAANMCDNAFAVEVAIAGELVDTESNTRSDLGYAVLGSNPKSCLPRTVMTRFSNAPTSKSYRYTLRFCQAFD